jgi:hypothetical protein
MSRSSRRLAALVAVVAVLGAGCTDQDVDGSDAASVLQDAGAPEAVQTCVGDRLDDELDQGQLNEVGGADELSELDTDLEQTVREILDECVEGEGSGSDEGDGETTETTGGESGDGDESTTTTSAEG